MPLLGGGAGSRAKGFSGTVIGSMCGGAMYGVVA
jgi:hypothetical protein